MPEVFNASGYLVDRQVAAGLGEPTAVIAPTRSMTYAELADEVARTAGALTALGVRPEERVMLRMLDGASMLAGILGAMWLGAVAVPVSTMLTGAELVSLLTDSRAHAQLGVLPAGYRRDARAGPGPSDTGRHRGTGGGRVAVPVLRRTHLLRRATRLRHRRRYVRLGAPRGFGR